MVTALIGCAPKLYIYGAVHLVTTYFVQAPNWSDLEIFVEIEISYRI